MAEYKKNYIILHHTVTARDTTTFEAVNNYHKEKWNFKSSLGFYIGYQYFITGDGTLYQGRADLEPGAHCYQENKNYDSIGICLTGHFDQEHPSEAQLNTLRDLIRNLMAKHGIPFSNLKYHRDYAPKTCPGTNIPNDFYTTLLNSDNDMMRLIQKSGDKDVYAVDKYNRRHSILNWDTFQRGLAMGLWLSNIETVTSLESFPAGNVIVLVSDN